MKMEGVENDKSLWRMSEWKGRERVRMNKLNWTDRERFGDEAKVVTES